MTPEKIDALKRFFNDPYSLDCNRPPITDEIMNEAIAELRSHKEQVRCGGCRNGRILPDSSTHLWCSNTRAWRKLDWYCADAEAKV